MDAVSEIRRSKWDRFGGWATLLAVVLASVPIAVTGLRSGSIVHVAGSALQQGGDASLAKRDYWLLSGASLFAGVWIGHHIEFNLSRRHLLRLIGLLLVLSGGSLVVRALA